MQILYRALADLSSIAEVVIVCSATSDLCKLKDHPKVKIVTADRIKHRELNRLYMGLGGLKAIVLREKPDVVLAMNLSSYVHLGVPSILSVNNPYQVYPKDINAYHPGKSPRVAILRWFFRRSLSRTDGMVFQTNLMKDYAQKFLQRPIPSWTIGKAVEDDTDVAPEPVPDCMERSMAVAMGTGSFRFLYVATPLPHKNHLVLYKAMEIVRAEKWPIHLLLTLSRAEVEATGGQLGTSLIASGHIVPLGFVEKRHLLATYNAVDACVMPSVLESLSSAHLEAMKWRKPQITVDLPYARDLCGDAAIYCIPDDALAWAQAMRRMISEVDLRARLIAEGAEIMNRMPKTVPDAASRLNSALIEVIRLSPKKKE